MRNLKIANLTLTVLLGLTFVSCSSMKPINVRVVSDKTIHVKPLTRSDKFLGCLSKLNFEGFKQSLIVDMCNSTYGSID